jgi:hypothetical protein
MYGAVKLVGLILGAAAINLPLGYLRSSFERFTLGWFFCVHLSIPIIIFLRFKASFTWHIIPLTIGGAIAGQLIGGVLRGRGSSHD